MARVDISTSSKLSPDSAWKLASDLSRFGDWMTIFGGWRGEVPDEIEGHLRVVAHQGQGIPQRHPLDRHAIRRAESESSYPAVDAAGYKSRLA